MLRMTPPASRTAVRGKEFGCSAPPFATLHVLPGLVPGIHAQKPSPTSKVACSGAAWMAGTSPATTSMGGAQPDYISGFATSRFPRTRLAREEARAFLLSRSGRRWSAAPTG